MRQYDIQLHGGTCDTRQRGIHLMTAAAPTLRKTADRIGRARGIWWQDQVTSPVAYDSYADFWVLSDGDRLRTWPDPPFSHLRDMHTRVYSENVTKGTRHERQWKSDLSADVHVLRQLAKTDAFDAPETLWREPQRVDRLAAAKRSPNSTIEWIWLEEIVSDNGNSITACYRKTRPYDKAADKVKRMSEQEGDHKGNCSFAAARMGHD